MKTLDRYIIKQFLLNFAILLLVFLALFLVVDLIVDLDEFLEAGRLRADAFGGVIPATLWTIVDYYGPVAMLLYVFFSGLLVVAAAGFTFAGLTRTGELVAMVTGGISMYRICAPVVILGCLLNALTLPLQELVIPKMADKLARSKSQVKLDTAGGFPVQFAPDGRGNLLSAARFDTIQGQPMLEGVTILHRDDNGRALTRVTAEQAFWDENRKGWELVGALAINPQFDVDPASDAASHPREAATVEFFHTDLSPTILMVRRATIYPMLLSLAELKQLTSDTVNPPKIRRMMHSRLTMLVMNVLVLVMGLPFFMQREPANLLAEGIKAAGVCLAVWGVGLVMLQVGIPGLNSVAAAWLPVVLDLPLAAVLLQTLKT